MHNNESNSKLSLNKTSLTSKSTKTLTRFKQRALEQERALEQKKLSASIEHKVEANPWTRGTLYSQNKNNDRFSDRKERFARDFSERNDRNERTGRDFFDRNDRNERRGRGFSQGKERFARDFNKRASKRRFDEQNLYDVVGGVDFNSESKERHVIDARSIYECEVPIGRMTELAICEIGEKGAFVDAKDHGPLFIPKSQLSDNAQVGDLIRVFLYKDGERTLATARRPYIELGMTGNLRINSVQNGTAYLDLGIPKELVLPVSEQRFRMYEGDNALVLVCIDSLGRLFGTQCFNRYIRDKAYTGEFNDNQRVKIVAVAHTPLGFRVIVDDKVYGLIYESEQKGELIIGKRYDGFVRAVRDDGRLDISLQETGRDGVEHASLDILQALYFSQGKFDFNDKSEPEKIEEYLKMSKGRFKKALGALYKQRLVEITYEGVLLTEDGNNFAKERFAYLANKQPNQKSFDSDNLIDSNYDDMDALANVDVGADQDPMVDAVISAVAQARKEGKLPNGYQNPEVREFKKEHYQSHTLANNSDIKLLGENLDELGDFALRRSAINEGAGFANERKSRHERKGRNYSRNFRSSDKGSYNKEHKQGSKRSYDDRKSFNNEGAKKFGSSRRSNSFEKGSQSKDRNQRSTYSSNERGSYNKDRRSFKSYRGQR